MTMATDDLNVLRAARMHRVVNKLKSVSVSVTVVQSDLGYNLLIVLSCHKHSTDYQCVCIVDSVDVEFIAFKSNSSLPCFAFDLINYEIVVS